MTRYELHNKESEINLRYDGLFNELREKHNEEVKKLGIDFAESNNPVRIGDIISSVHNTIRVDKMEVVFMEYCLPMMRYAGYELSRLVDGRTQVMPYRKEITQMNVRKINGDQYGYFV